MLKVFEQSLHCPIKNSQSVVLSSIIFSLEMGMVEDKSLCIPYTF